MSKVLDIANFTGIIKPGDIYIITSDAGRGADAGPIEYLYTIRSIEEIPSAIEMEMEIVLAEMYEYRQFLGVNKNGDQRCQIMLLCYDKAVEKEITYSFFLHRIQTFEESLCDVKRMFGIS
jgi:hypothetical protein